MRDISFVVSPIRDHAFFKQPQLQGLLGNDFLQLTSFTAQRGLRLSWITISQHDQPAGWYFPGNCCVPFNLGSRHGHQQRLDDLKDLF